MTTIHSSLPRRRVPVLSTLAIAAALVAAGPASAGERPARWQDVVNSASDAQSGVDAGTRVSRGIGALQLFATLSEFQTATAGWALAHEDFAVRPFNSASPCYEPVNSAMGQPGTSFLSPVCFQPGTVIPGFSIRSNLDTGAHGFGTMAFSPPIGGLSMVVVGATSPGTETFVDFTDGAMAVAMQAFDWQAGSPLTFDVLGKDGRHLGDFTLTPTVPPQGVFVGLVSPDPIYRVKVRSASGASQMIGDLRFGGQPAGFAVDGVGAHFGAVPVGATSTLNVTLRQTGDLPIHMPVIPAPEAPFSVVSDDCSAQEVAVGDTCVITYAYAPSYMQAHRQLLALPTPGGGTGEDTLLLTGRAVSPRLDVDSSVLAFGEVAVGQSATASTVLANVEAVTLAVSSIDSVSAPFALVNGADACPAAPFELAPGEWCRLTWQVTPVTSQAQRARVLVTSNDPSSPRRLLLQVGVDDRLFQDGFESPR